MKRERWTAYAGHGVSKYENGTILRIDPINGGVPFRDTSTTVILDDELGQTECCLCLLQRRLTLMLRHHSLFLRAESPNI